MISIYFSLNLFFGHEQPKRDCMSWWEYREVIIIQQRLSWILVSVGFFFFLNLPLFPGRSLSGFQMESLRYLLEPLSLVGTCASALYRSLRSCSLNSSTSWLLMSGSFSWPGPLQILGDLKGRGGMRRIRACSREFFFSTDAGPSNLDTLLVCMPSSR